MTDGNPRTFSSLELLTHAELCPTCHQQVKFDRVRAGNINEQDAWYAVALPCTRLGCPSNALRSTRIPTD